MLKKSLRNIYKQKRLDLTEQQYDKKNDLILIQFQKINLPFIHTVFSYFPLSHLMEPDTFLITRFLRHQNPQVQIAYPTMQNNGSMLAVIAEEDSEFTLNTYGINELQEGAILDPKRIDLVLIPMLVCDTNGNRVGYGKGFYDKYLETCNSDLLKIGLSFFDPVDRIEDVEEFDVPLTHCITPETVYEF